METGRVSVVDSRETYVSATARVPLALTTTRFYSGRGQKHTSVCSISALNGRARVY